ncbi:uncharacterized protein LOC108412730 [Pygocentrus nattereri]|uniref:Fibronectin type-III domain-containing protein n=1 Tax=Pygocentrus nattereri TaxID=42514 RepID=A0A3B4D497_PYGNA|nr:uncharacterized protein LOC108412730 [Pygocentrus nattereri]XP_037400678.1 uncharacterized protein LOC108412730 [Pygocentrus nattereri]
MSDSKTFELAVLGRPFQLGMLYDCRRDALIPGITLWDSETLMRNVNVRPQPNTEFKIIASDSSEEKLSALNVNASLEASFLCGLVSVKGSAQYLNDKKKSTRQSRVTLQYKSTTRFEQLTMEHLGIGNVKHCNVFEEGSATHVVTALLYGAQAFFVFDQEVSSNESHQEIHGNLQACIKNIPTISIEGQASLDMTDDENQRTNKFTCTFHGDFALESNPVSYQEAIKVYSQIPKLLGENGEHAVPVSAWLYPLRKLDTAAAQMVREISVGLVRGAQRIMDELDDADMQCQDLMKVDMAIQFPEIKAKLRKFKSLSSEYKLVFQKKLSKLLPSIRGGGKEEQDLVTLLTSKERSPFQSVLMSAYLNDREREMNIIRSYLEIMREVPVLSSSKDLDKAVLKANTDYVVAFAFSSLKEEESYLLDLENYLKEVSRSGEEHFSYEATAPKKSEQWFCSKDVSALTRQNIQLFLDFKRSNNGRQNIDFFIVSIPDNHVTASSIHVYEKGICLSSEFELPSEPHVPSFLRAEHDQIHLQIKPPAHGISSVESYCVSHQTVQSSDWTEVTTEGNSLSVTIKQLEPNEEYRFKCKAVCRPGVSLSSEETAFFKTHPCGPPGPLKLKSKESDKITITWDMPTSIGKDIQVIGYVVEFQEQPKKEQIAEVWESIRIANRQCTIQGLRADTDYRIRVLANCAPAGMSLPTPESMFTTTKLSDKSVQMKSAEASSQLFLEKSFLLKKGNPSIYVLNQEKKFRENEQFNQYAFGRKVEQGQNKVLLLLGSTGAGKTTLVNAMVNYILGVKWQEHHRFKLIHEVTNRTQAESQTSEVTSYELYNQPGFQVPYSLTIVDTPGFGDTRGMDQDKLIIEKMKSFLCSPLGINHINAVCFVVQASLARLSAAQKYIFDSVLSIFGKDVAENIIILVTFADGKDIPVLQAIKAAGLPCHKDSKGSPTHFRFNNSVIYTQKKVKNTSESDSGEDDAEEEDDEKLKEIVWTSNFKQMSKFFIKTLGVLNSKDLTLTKEVLEERERLEKAMADLTPQITAGLSMLNRIKAFKEGLKSESSNMKQNENFEQEVPVLKAKRTPVNCYTVNCSKCLFTCHSNCFLPEDDPLSTCAAMDEAGHCTVCSGLCNHSAHIKEKALWTYETKMEKQTIDELKENFMKAKGKFMNTKQMLDELESEFDVIEEKLRQLIKLSSSCLQRLNAIALKPTSLSTREYIEILIKTEKEEKKPGFEDRILGLEKIKQECIILDKIAKGEDLLESEQQVIAERKRRLKTVAMKAKKIKDVVRQWEKVTKPE